jgi:hypothetical protein
MSRETIGSSGLDRSPSCDLLLPCHYLHNRTRKLLTSQEVSLVKCHLRREISLR